MGFAKLIEAELKDAKPKFNIPLSNLYPPPLNAQHHYLKPTYTSPNTTTLHKPLATPNQVIYLYDILFQPKEKNIELKAYDLIVTRNSFKATNVQ